jgi:hypothetical protein
MPAQSKAQQRFMGMVHAAQKGDMENPSPEVSKAADSMSDKDAKDFASTSHKGLPDHVKEFIVREVRGVKTIHKEYADVVDQIQKHLELYKQTKGTPQEKQHIQQLKQLNDKKKALASELDKKVTNMYVDAELQVDEMNVTGNVDGYGTPFAFGKGEDEKTKGKRQADLTGYSVVKEGYTVRGNNPYQFVQGANSVLSAYLRDEKMGSKEEKMLKDVISNLEYLAKYFYSQRNESMNENRWVALRKEDSTPTQKIGRGISNINKQLKEMEQFLSWYGKIKNENGVSNKNFWKRTNSHIYNIKERLLKLDQQIRKISE